MGLASGTKLGPYEIVALMGAGGMGEVYRARDTRLERSVAIKVLPPHLAEKADAAERFEREARAISSLNHPNICQLHDVGTDGGMRYLVMELLEGETLSERLRRGPMPLEQVLRYGAEIADGLHAAHRRGVVHRDLKPGNVMLTKSGAKLMDFGLAKGTAVSKPVSTELTATLTSSHAAPLTQQGTIVGTFQYMSPEQVEGREADARSDIFNLGAVLYEMVSGKRAFEGKTLVSVAASILEKEPDPIRTVQPLTPASLERVIRKCLAKDPDERWQSAGDLASELRWIADGTASGTHAATQFARGRGMRVSEWLAWMFCAMAIIAVIVLSLVLGFSGGNKPVVRTQIAPSEKLQFNFVGDNGGPPVISPDGTHIVFSARSEGKTQLFLRSLDQLNPVPLPGTEEASFPFWSPDNRSIAFFAGGKLKRIDIGNGSAVNICDAPTARGGAWGTKGIILFSPNTQQPLVRVSAMGGTPMPVTALSETYTTHRWPALMPDGEHFVYFAANHNAPSSADTAIFWASMDGKQNKFLLHTLSNAIFASGYLLYVRENELMARRFNPSTGDFEGEATVLNDDVQVDGSVWRGTFTSSDNGTLLYQPGMASAGLMRLTWLDATGKELGTGFAPDAYVEVQISPDDRKAAVVIGNPGAMIWIYDLAHGMRTRFSFGAGRSGSPLWSHDGKQLAYLTLPPNANPYFAIKAADGSGEEKRVHELDPNQRGVLQALWDWSPDGRYLLYNVGAFGVGTGEDIWVLPVTGDGKPFPYAAGPGDQMYAQFSPDGRWVAYVSNETGKFELYVAPFPWTGAKWQVSSGGGWVPRWAKNGKEIFYQAPGSTKTWVAQVDGHGSSFEVGTTRVAFDFTSLSPNISAAQYAVTGNGERFLEITTGDAGRLPLTVIQNWTAELKRK